ncbi:MAG TPA: hypothetical protein VK024_07810 [Actinomycetaceae bacterium]|nr:hypothetical protein [Actinomycetaceae bacterium]
MGQLQGACINLMRRRLGAHINNGSRAQGATRMGSDVYVAAVFGRRSLHPWEVLLRDAADLLVLDTALLELSG